MGLYVLTDTICALATPPGTGAIAVIRMSGPDSFTILRQVFRKDGTAFQPEHAGSHTIHFGLIGDATGLLDEVLVSIFRKPHSYTGEDVVEISCHGSLYIQQRITEKLLQSGCRMARPGEFTLRAFMNGKMDLSQAEAVADLIAAQSKSAHDLALEQVRGGFAREIQAMWMKLIDFVSLIELELDFSEEDVEFANRTALLELAAGIRKEVARMIGSFRMGNVIKNGIPVAIIGKPNVGKSTLLNAILNEERAIVSDIPGTTRDAIEDTIVIEGYSFRFIDTAGLRAGGDMIENMGMERTWQKIGEASIILYVFDATSQTFEEVSEEISGFNQLIEKGKKHLILVGNKTDQLSELPKRFSDFVTTETVFVSAKRKENIHLLAGSLRKTVMAADISDQTIISNTRHYQSLTAAGSSLDAVIKGLESGLTGDLLSTDIRDVIHHLGEISGEITTDEILGTIFGKFCIGK